MPNYNEDDIIRNYNTYAKINSIIHTNHNIINSLHYIFESNLKKFQINRKIPTNGTETEFPFNIDVCNQST